MKKTAVIGLMLQIASYVHYARGLQIKATCDNQMHFYVDGTEYSSPNKNDWTTIDTINVPTNGDVFGIKCINSGGPGAIIMSTSDGRWSNTQDWKCTNTEQSGWSTRNFSDSSWSTPVDFGKLGAQIWAVVSGINTNAHWIWTPGGTINNPSDSTVWCRTHIKVYGMWSAWTSWGTCTQTCATGTQTRTRSCSDPAPAYGGDDCVGTSDSPQTQNCSTQACPIHGNWGAWSAVSGSCNCAAQNALGVQTYTRQCNNPAPQYNGTDCATNIDDGTKTETDCACNINGNWATWGSYGDCSATCGEAVKTRTRTCSNPSQANNGTDCAPPGSESVNCTWVDCPVHGGWSVWQNATNCNCAQDSFDGTRDQSRQCNNPTPEHNGTDCSGPTTNEIYCNCITEIPGNDIFNYTRNGTCSEVYNVTGTTGSLSNCLLSCYQDSTCVAFVYLQTSNTPCYKMTGCTAADATDDSVLFVKINPPTSIDTTTTSSNGTAGTAEAQVSAAPVIAMAAVGSSIGLLALLALLILFVLRRRKKKKEEEDLAAAEASAFQQSNATTGATETNDTTVEDVNADSSK